MHFSIKKSAYPTRKHIYNSVFFVCVKYARMYLKFLRNLTSLSDKNWTVVTLNIPVPLGQSRRESKRARGKTCEKLLFYWTNLFWKFLCAVCRSAKPATWNRVRKKSTLSPLHCGPSNGSSSAEEFIQFLCNEYPLTLNRVIFILLSVLLSNCKEQGVIPINNCTQNTPVLIVRVESINSRLMKNPSNMQHLIR